MYKNQLQELAQRSCFNFPSYSCIREGPDHAPRFKATVNFNGETFESPAFCPTLRQAEHAAAEVALSVLANRGPSRALAARVLDETGVYKNLLQETAHRAGLHLPVYTTSRSGPSHVPVFSCIVELAGLRFLGEPAKTKKQAQKNAAIAAWSSLRKLANCSSSSSPSLSNSSESEDIEQDQVIVARALASLRSEESKRSTQTNCQGGQQTSNHNTRDLYLASSSLRPMMYDSCAYPSFSTEIAPYRIWQRTQLLQLQNPQLPVSIPLAPPFRLHFPFLQSPYQHDHLHFAAREQELIPVGHGVQVAAFSPSIYLSDHLISSSVRNRSMVTIQEIQEDKIDKCSELCSSELLNFPICQDHKTEPLAQKLAVVDTKQTCGEPEGKLGESNQLEEKPRGEFDQDAPNTPNFEFQPVQFELRNQYGQSSSLPNVRHHHFSIPNYHGIAERPSTVAAPTRIRSVSPVPAFISGPQCLANEMSTPPNMRTGGPKFLTRPRSEFGVPSRFMAPPVRIRSVIPVSSAPPAKKIPISSQQGESSFCTNKHNSTEDASTAGSELGKLQI